MEFKRVRNDVNGNPRYVFHFLAFLKDDTSCEDLGGVLNAVENVANHAKKLGFSKYRGKDFGGGLVTQSDNIQDTIRLIEENRI